MPLIEAAWAANTTEYEQAKELAIKVLYTSGLQSPLVKDVEDVPVGEVVQTALTIALGRCPALAEWFDSAVLPAFGVWNDDIDRAKCGHPKYGSTSRCAEMTCTNYINKEKKKS